MRTGVVAGSLVGAIIAVRHAITAQHLVDTDAVRLAHELRRRLTRRRRRIVTCMHAHRQQSHRTQPA